MLLINKELLNPSQYKQKIIDYYNKNLMFIDDGIIKKFIE